MGHRRTCGLWILAPGIPPEDQRGPLGTEVVTVIERWLRSTVTLGSTVVTVLNNVNTDLYKNCNLLEMNVADGVPI